MSTGDGWRLVSLRSPLKVDAMTSDQIGHPDTALSLSLAMVECSQTPLLLLDGELQVICASVSFCTAFGIPIATTFGRLLPELGEGEWAVPQLTSLLRATVSGQAAIIAYEMDLKRKGLGARCLIINAQKLKYGQDEQVRLLVAIQDITDQRASEKHRDDLVREKAVLLQELQHRVANSLQIIASVLMQSARTAVSDEAKGHLFAAHNRVVSVAALQDHLAPSHVGDVKLRPYFTSLCESIGASMIHDHKLVSIEVAGDDSAVPADMSVSLGLITTELVINALKHAFGGGRTGQIKVGYWSQKGGWILRVSDDGVGMPEEMKDAKAGLGTTIVRSLAEQLQARVEVVDADPGTEVSIIHSEREEQQNPAAAPAV